MSPSEIIKEIDGLKNGWYAPKGFPTLQQYYSTGELIGSIESPNLDSPFWYAVSFRYEIRGSGMPSNQLCSSEQKAKEFVESIAGFLRTLAYREWLTAHIN